VGEHLTEPEYRGRQPQPVLGKDHGRGIQRGERHVREGRRFRVEGVVERLVTLEHAHVDLTVIINRDQRYLF
jgi:hypothetical protein